MEVFLKITIKYLSENIEKNNEAANALLLAKGIITKNPALFEMALKLIYLNYLTVGKATNLYSISSIHEMQENIINILSIDLEKAYITIFSFIRKLCINLRATLTDKVNTYYSTFRKKCQSRTFITGNFLIQYIYGQKVNIHF